MINFEVYTKVDGAGTGWTTFYEKWRTTPNTTVFINGYYTPTFPEIVDLVIGDSVRVIEENVTLHHASGSINRMSSYYSTLDKRNKVIVNLDVGANNFFYLDDAMFYVVAEWTSPAGGQRRLKLGKLLTRTDKSVVRHLTHRDLAIDINLVNAMTESWFREVGNPVIQDTQIHVVYRKNKRDFANVLDHHRILDLCRLPDAIRNKALTGYNSTLDFWKADALESAPYNLWISSTSQELVQRSVYGVFSREGAIYNLERMQEEGDGTNIWKYPPLVGTGECRILSFTEEGKRKTFDNRDNEVLIPGNNIYRVRPNASGLELVLPNVDEDLMIDSLMPANVGGPATVNGSYDYMVIIDEGDDDLRLGVEGVDYTVEGTVMSFSPEAETKDRYIREAQRRREWFRTGLNYLDLSYGTRIIDQDDTRNRMEVGMGNRFFWLNGNLLIEGLDYALFKPTSYRKNVDTLFILLTKEYHIPSNNKLEFLEIGLPDESLRHVSKFQYGFVRDGKISFDDTYEFHGDRHKWLTINGRVLPLEQYSHEILIDKEAAGDVIDGKPYAIIDLPVLSNQRALDDLCPPLIYDKNVNRRISEYVTENYPQPTEGEENTGEPYKVYSPFINALIQEMLDGNIIPLYNRPSLETCEMLTVNIRWMLEFDPTRLDVDPSRIEIHPRLDNVPVELPKQQYSTLLKCIEYYCDNRIAKINEYVTEVGDP